MMFGERVPLLRLAQNGDTGSAELIVWWAVLADSTATADTTGAVRCGPRADDQRMCTVRKQLDFRQVARDLDSLGAWTLALDCAPGLALSISDAGELLIQRVTGARRTGYTCNAPQHRNNAPGKQAQAIMVYLYQLTRDAGY